jgi:hypothetical protein
VDFLSVPDRSCTQPVHNRAGGRNIPGHKGQQHHGHSEPPNHLPNPVSHGRFPSNTETGRERERDVPFSSRFLKPDENTTDSVTAQQHPKKTRSYNPPSTGPTNHRAMPIREEVKGKKGGKKTPQKSGPWDDGSEVGSVTFKLSYSEYMTQAVTELWNNCFEV